MLTFFFLPFLFSPPFFRPSVPSDMKPDLSTIPDSSSTETMAGAGKRKKKKQSVTFHHSIPDPDVIPPAQSQRERLSLLQRELLNPTFHVPTFSPPFSSSSAKSSSSSSPLGLVLKGDPPTIFMPASSLITTMTTTTTTSTTTTTTTTTSTTTTTNQAVPNYLVHHRATLPTTTTSASDSLFLLTPSTPATHNETSTPKFQPYIPLQTRTSGIGRGLATKTAQRNAPPVVPGVSMGELRPQSSYARGPFQSPPPVRPGMPQILHPRVQALLPKHAQQIQVQ